MNMNGLNETAAAFISRHCISRLLRSLLAQWREIQNIFSSSLSYELSRMRPLLKPQLPLTMAAVASRLEDIQFNSQDASFEDAQSFA